MIHRYQLDGIYIVLDIESGSVHRVDPVAYEAIGLLDAAGGPAPDGSLPRREAVLASLAEGFTGTTELSRSDFEEVLEEIQELILQGLLFAPATDVAASSGPAGLSSTSTDGSSDGGSDGGSNRGSASQVIKALCLHVAHSCNLACDYCFAGQGDYQGGRGLMPLSVAKEAMDFLVANSGARRNLEVDFFGGEPLLNWEVVKETVRYARELERRHPKRFRFTLTTNGVLLDPEVTEFCNREMDNVVLSLDGRKDVHDRLRKTRDGSGSYNLVLPRFQDFVAARQGKGYYIRGTFTHDNLDFTRDLYHMADLGFSELSMEPVVSRPGEPFALTEADLPVLYGQYEELAREMLKRDGTDEAFTFYHYMLDLEDGPCIYKRITGCGSGTEYLAVTPWGDLYPCHQFVGEEPFRMGSLREGVTRPDLAAAFRSCNALTRPACRECWAKLYCSGGCAANAYHAEGDIAAVYEYGCKLFRKRMECAVLMAVVRQERLEHTLE